MFILEVTISSKFDIGNISLLSRTLTVDSTECMPELYKCLQIPDQYLYTMFKFKPIITVITMMMIMIMMIIIILIIMIEK